MVELVRPGGFDQDFPSYNTALSFYHVLAASITFNLEEPPGYLKHICQPGTETVYDSRGSIGKIRQMMPRKNIYIWAMAKRILMRKLNPQRIASISATETVVWKTR